jgi:hypothetical protein
MDAGLEAVSLLRNGLMIDEQWIIDRDRGFSWMAHNLVQHIDASPTFQSRGIEVSLVTVRTPLARQIRTSQERANEFLLHLNSLAVGSALTFDSEKSTVSAIMAHHVHQETLEFRPSTFTSWRFSN